MKFSIRWTQPHRSNPKAKPNYRKFKPILQQDFHQSCGYCGIHHVYFGSGSGFHIDHFAPKSKFDDIEHAYSNLVYSCPICNIAKSNHWVGTLSVQRTLNGEGFVDPCDPEYDDHFYRDSAGKIRYEEDNSVAKYMHKKMKFSLKRHEIFWLAEYLFKLVNTLNEKLEELGDDHPFSGELKNLYEKSTKEMIKYQNFLREV